jgi:hypothetical protein
MEKVAHKIWATYVHTFQLAAQSKLSPNGRKFAQSGHPVYGPPTFGTKSVKVQILINQTVSHSLTSLIINMIYFLRKSRNIIFLLLYKKTFKMNLLLCS